VQGLAAVAALETVPYGEAAGSSISRLSRTTRYVKSRMEKRSEREDSSPW